MLLSRAFLDFLKQSRPSQVWLAFSGGMDSIVLLNSLHEYLKSCAFDCQLAAIHIHHGLQDDADSWADFCRAEADACGIAYHEVRVQITPGDNGIEAAARDARYDAMKNLLANGDVLCTAHHQDDQAETLLLQLLRGAGPKGLSAMPAVQAFGPGYLVRPLLDVTREKIETHAREQQLQWIDDPSNSDTRFDRNYLRHVVMPLITERWPSGARTLSRSAALCAETVEVAELALAPHASLFEREYLSVPDCVVLPAALQNWGIRHWLAYHGYPLPQQKQFNEILNALTVREDANVLVAWPGAYVYRYRDQLHACRQLPPPQVDEQIEWDLSAQLTLPNDLGVLQARQVRGEGFVLRDDNRITVCFRQDGMRVHPAGRQGSHPLKKCFQEWDVPTRWRGVVPLLKGGSGEIVAVVGHCVCAGYAAGADELGWVVEKI
jgi:tRNA(Ile)-lysidine synthase